MSRPLEGLLIIAIEQAVAAPLCTARLADAGARVIKIERPEGDFARNYDTAAEGDSSYFAWLNQGKESVALDYREPPGRTLLDALISKADVVVQNMAPGALERAGFGSKTLRDRHTSLITCDITGYGDNEEMASMKAYDLLVQAECGLVTVSGGENETGRIGVSVCDIGAGITAHAAVLEAIIHRGNTGEGTGVATSLFEVAAEWMSVPLIHTEYGDGAPKRVGLNHPSIAPYGAYKTSDGAETLISIQNEREWNILCEKVLRLSGMAQDNRFNTNNNRVANRPALDKAISAISTTVTSAEFRKRLIENSIAFGAVNAVEDVVNHPAISKRQMTNSVECSLMIPAPPVRWPYEARLSPGPVPKLGEHTDRIRREFLGS